MTPIVRSHVTWSVHFVDSRNRRNCSRLSFFLPDYHHPPFPNPLPKFPVSVASLSRLSYPHLFPYSMR
ncbi:hypothetical protein WG66_009829, partial [Moniliophthora roreri]